MFTTIARKIVGIALVLIVLMTTTSVVSTVLVIQTGYKLDDIVQTYIPAYGDLARADIRSLERALALRRMVIEKLMSRSTGGTYQAAQTHFEERGKDVETESEAARALINGLIAKGVSGHDSAILGRMDSRIETAINATRRELNEEIGRLFPAMDKADSQAIDDEMTRVLALRNELNEELESIRAEMLVLLNENAKSIARDQRGVIFVSIVLTLIAAMLGVAFSLLISERMTKPVRRLLDSARAVAAGHLDQQLVVQSHDEIGRLTVEFNNMIEQLKEKERLRETFGKYVDPRVVEGLMNRPDLAREGHRRIMTIMFCDIKGFTQASEQMTPQGLVKIMNRYFSVMSDAIGHHEGVIDKYIGDAIMAYWGAPFVVDADQARLASMAALEMRERLPSLRAEFPELIGLRELPMSFDIRIGIATGEALVGSIGSDIMMSYTVMGDTVNLASRLEGINKMYGSHVMVSEATVNGAVGAIEAREIDRVVVLGQTKAQSIFEILAPAGGLSARQIELRTRFAEGLETYRSQRWDDARHSFIAALEAVPEDGPSITFINRIDKLAANPPGDNWDGAWHFDQK